MWAYSYIGWTEQAAIDWMIFGVRGFANICIGLGVCGLYVCAVWGYR